MLWTLVAHDGMLVPSILRRRMKMKLAELDPILQDLEWEGKIIRAELEPIKDKPQQLIMLKCNH